MLGQVLDRLRLTSKWVWGPLCALILIAIAAAVLWNLRQRYAYTVRGFSGDGQITDTGFWSYPRYHVALPRIRIGENKTYTFSFQGVPREHLGFGLNLDDLQQHVALQAIKDKIKLGVRLQDNRGNVLCEVSAPLGQWREAWSQTRVYYWHDQCRDCLTRPDCSYTVTLTVEGAPENVAPILLTPILEGGGNET
jgi:hypothetical protein